MSEENVKRLKKIILQTSYKTGEGHVPSAFSILDILYVLYHGGMNIDSGNPDKNDRDYLVVSKGHAAIGVYAVLADAGFFPMEELDTFGRYQSRLGGHPDFNKVPGIEASTGSLRHGFPMAAGMALGLKMKKKGQKVFCILGDGEANDGSVWEAVLLAGQQGLDNFVCFFDYNNSIQKYIAWGNMAEKFSAFGWDTMDIDGHDHKQIYEAINKAGTGGKPLAVIAHTIKGNGCKTMEEEPSAWHHRSPSAGELESLLRELG